MAEQIVYQTLYLNPSAAPKNRLVLIDPILDDPITGLVFLKSLQKEKLPGMVLSGTKTFVNMLRRKLEALDPKTIESLRQAIRALLKDLEITTVYAQGELLDFWKQP